MKTLSALILLAAAAISPKAHAIYFECKAPNINATVTPVAAPTHQCRTGMAVQHKGVFYCISNLSHQDALAKIQRGGSQPYDVCGEFTSKSLTNGGFQNVARLKFVIEMGLEAAGGN